MSDLSNREPMESLEFDRGNPGRRCTAHRKNGERCRKWAILGGTVCATHGGRARQVREKAQRRLAEAADRMARELLNMATNPNVSDAVKLAAIRDALDRSGISPKTAIEIGVSVKPWEAIMETIGNVDSGSRADYRRGIGAGAGGVEPADVADLSPDNRDHDGLIDAEFLAFEPDGRHFAADVAATPDYTYTGLIDAAAHAAGVGDGWLGYSGSQAVARQADAGMMPLEDAVAAQAAMRRAGPQVTAQRALPPGRPSQ